MGYDTETLSRGDTPTVVVATRNAGKLGELRPFFSQLGYHAIDLEQAGVAPSAAEDDLERFLTFEANAVAKARYYHRVSRGLPTVADDSGLEVVALGGAPGIYSKRWAGSIGTDAEISAANNNKLLTTLAEAADAADVADAAHARDRDARFVTVVVWVDVHGMLIGRGAVEGRIARAPRGSGGFGYDPLFESSELGWRTFAEVAATEKARIGHRGRALVELARGLRETSLERPVDARLDAPYTVPSRGA